MVAEPDHAVDLLAPHGFVAALSRHLVERLLLEYGHVERVQLMLIDEVALILRAIGARLEVVGVGKVTLRVPLEQAYWYLCLNRVEYVVVRASENLTPFSKLYMFYSFYQGVNSIRSKHTLTRN